MEYKIKEMQARADELGSKIRELRKITEPMRERRDAAHAEYADRRAKMDAEIKKAEEPLIEAMTEASLLQRALGHKRIL